MIRWAEILRNVNIKYLFHFEVYFHVLDINKFSYKLAKCLQVKLKCIIFTLKNLLKRAIFTLKNLLCIRYKISYINSLRVYPPSLN